MNPLHAGLAAFVLAAAPIWAAADTIFKCAGTDRQMHYQATPCEAGQQGDQLVIRKTSETPESNDPNASVIGLQQLQKWLLHDGVGRRLHRQYADRYRGIFGYAACCIRTKDWSQVWRGSNCRNREWIHARLQIHRALGKNRKHFPLECGSIDTAKCVCGIAGTVCS